MLQERGKRKHDLSVLCVKCSYLGKQESDKQQQALQRSWALLCRLMFDLLKTGLLVFLLHHKMKCMLLVTEFKFMK